jgi:cystathionine beta-lyase/cystathionine gamma-synthase
MNDATVLVQTKGNVSNAKPIVTPIYQSSAFHSGDPYFYSRKTNPNFEEVESVLSKMDMAADAVLFSSGMAAISAVLGLLGPGKILTVNRLVYGCSYRLLADYGEQYGVEVRYQDFCDTKLGQPAMDSRTDMVFFETPTNPFLRTVPIAKIAELLHGSKPEGLVVVDNTWATPLFQKPLRHGADVCVYSCSKFFSGHSDLILGAVTTSNVAVAERLRKTRFYQGSVPDPFASWLLRRSLYTLHVRMEQHQRNTGEVVSFLRGHPAVQEVYFPDVDGVQLKGYGGLLFARLKWTSFKAVEHFMQSLKLFEYGTSMAGVTSAVACPYYGSHLSMTTEEKKSIQLENNVVRLSIGLEDTGDLISDLSRALDAATADEGS